MNRETRRVILEEEPRGFCANQCQASRSPVELCTCVCRGTNHGLLVHRPVKVTIEQEENPRVWVPGWGYKSKYEEPGEESKPLLSYRPEPKPDWLRNWEKDRPRYSTKEKVARGIGKGLAWSFRKTRAKVTGKLSETELNDEVFHGLRRQFNEERVNVIIEESFTEYHLHNPDLNNPELYELYETGIIDNVLERRNIRWVLGRPKIKTRR